VDVGQERRSRASLHRQIDRRNRQPLPAGTGLRLTAEVGQLSARTALDEQRHKVPDWAAVEPCVVLVNDLSHGVRGQVRVALPESVNDLSYSRPFA